MLFQSTLSMRRATWTIRFDVLARLVISIHALHEESDEVFALVLTVLDNISIHALHEESDSAIVLPCGVG